MNSTVKRWLVPDLALASAIVTVLYSLLLFNAPQALFRDSDTGWHIRTGERIVASGELPRTDPYSFTRPGAPWFAWEWGSDVLMGAFHDRWGPGGVVLLYLAAIGLCTWLWFRLTWVVGGDFLLACLFASPMLSTVNLHWLARPHVFSWVLVLVWLAVLERLPERMRWWHWAGVATGGALWANVHASFFLMPALALVYCAAGGATRARYAMAGAVSALGTLANPYGAGLHTHVAAYLSNGKLLARIGEFQTFNFHAEGALQILATVALCAAGGALALQQGRVHHFLLLFGFLLLGVRSARGLPVLALMLPFANRAIREGLTAVPAFAGALRYSGNLRRLELPFRGWVWPPLVAGLAFVILQSPRVRERTGFAADQFPVEAAEKVREMVPAHGRVLAPDKYGGYLIYRFRGERKVFFDGRSDFYGLSFMAEYVDLVQVRPGWEKILRRHGPTHALVPLNYSLADALPRIGWRELHRDSTAVLLAAPESSNSGGN
jgi:hypothetical protein